MVTLSARDRRNLDKVMHALLAPLEYASIDDWRAEANRLLKQAFDGDAAGFMLPTPQAADIYSEKVGDKFRDEYPYRVQSLEHLVRVYERGAALGAYIRRTLWGEHLEAYYQSAYYNELVRPTGVASAMASTVPMDETIQPDTIGHLIVTRTARQPRYETEDLAAFRLLLPAFRAGLVMWRQFHAQRAALVRTIDATGAAAWLCDEAGAVVHQTPALSGLLAADPEPDHIRGRLQQTARRVARLRRQGDPGDEVAVCVERVVRTRLAAYHVRGALAGPELREAGAPVLVVIEQQAAASVSPCELQERFGLTPRQGEVAQLLARRKTNQEIADALCISPHTARHHTEAVLRKLEVDSRRAVARRMAGKEDVGRDRPHGR